MLVFVVVAIGFLLYIAVLLAAMFLAGIIWALSSLGLWLLELKPRLTGQKKVANSSRRPPPVRDRAPRAAQAPAPSDIWPKWTPAHRRYVDQDLALWQKQFDALNSPK